MADAPRRPLRVLLSEGGSTSAREAITVLGLAGHRVEICDPSPRCLGRFSRFVAKFHRCPGLGRDPAGYLAFVEDLLARRQFDVLLPIHEQGLLFAKVAPRLQRRTALALPSFAAYRRVISKAGFSRLLDELALPQPPTRLVSSPDELREFARPPCVIKTAIGTASRGVWLVRDTAQLDAALRELTAIDGFADDVLLQDFVEGPVEHAQAVFADGELLAVHAYRRIADGAGGGAAIKQSVRRDAVRADLARIGKRLAWHGALSVDYILPSENASPRYIDCNPRLVEPMGATLAGLDLVDLLLRISLGQKPPPPADSRAGVRTHLGMQALLGCARHGGRRRELLRECGNLLSRRGRYAGSREELTPVGLDWPSGVPLAMTAALLLAAPSLAGPLAAKGWGDHLLDAGAVRRIDGDEVG
ncbi:putative ATP-grasp superfamily ATP-dependent carboligase [Rhodopseudomonas rhenobacensis]|uniref:Putative ATP-grasp superfamily ATP-dependent carboligase n=1 Tax=Rhodopseudomonas rhenobacensis TaxID=87461 RepID=A0A7W7YZX4_9BRAD|nr:hypothetical protein [Rhodopseudomonas rhenobacensis]MBB5045443.1 putative ATP-grasp superfamily ATP-dependent carboligase [Rhodopseudomonas rhenobacensis]